jgi:hypothetical protein
MNHATHSRDEGVTTTRHAAARTPNRKETAMKTTVKILIVALALLASAGGERAFALTYVTDEQIAAQQEYKSLQRRLAEIDAEIGKIRNLSSNNSQVFVYNFNGSGGWASASANYVAQVLRSRFRSEAEVRRQWNWILTYHQQKVRELQGRRLPYLAAERARVVARMNQLQAIISPRPVMPDLTRMPWQQAQAALARLGLGVRWQHKTTNHRDIEGHVATQWPAAGTQLTRGSSATVYVFKYKAPAGPQGPRGDGYVWVLRGSPEVTQPKSTRKANSFSIASLSGQTFRLHRQERHATTGKVVTDWDFSVTFGGQIPREIRPGQSIRLQLTGTAGGAKMAHYIGAGLSIREMGFQVHSNPPKGMAHYHGIFVGRSGSTGKLYTSASKTLTLTPSGAPGLLKLTLVGPNGGVVAYVWEKRAQ